MPVVAPKIVIRLGSHAEKEYVIKLARFLDGLIVGANLFEATPGATASLLLRTGFENTELYVDPMTYAYGTYIDPASELVRKDLDWIKSDQIRKDTRGNKRKVRDFKRSYKALANRLGPPVDQAVQTSVAVTPAAFGDDSVITAFCSKVLQYQLSRMSQELEKDNELKDHLNDVPHPKAVFAPYFYVEPTNSEDWLKTNLRLMEAAAALNDVHVPVHGILCADWSHLANEAIIRRLAEALPGHGNCRYLAVVQRVFRGCRRDSYLESLPRSCGSSREPTRGACDARRALESVIEQIWDVWSEPWDRIRGAERRCADHRTIHADGALLPTADGQTARRSAD